MAKLSFYPPAVEVCIRANIRFPSILKREIVGSMVLALMSTFVSNLFVLGIDVNRLVVNV